MSRLFVRRRGNVKVGRCLGGVIKVNVISVAFVD
jgi:hypothetical protein